MGIRNKKTLTKTRRHTRDIDQIKADLLSPKHLAQHKDSHAAEDLPGLGKHYCVECAKWFDAEVNLIGHRKGKPHRRRVKALSVEAYSQKEAEAARGIGSLDAPASQQTVKEVEMS
ncbi:hypothetical protein BR93DRAFT_184405 [Coniochaeta sp. PMI_546]|nr:hypothetical protein BR93DRAFT_184405 [Coniochaeta sp. PMI_546]